MDKDVIVSARPQATWPVVEEHRLLTLSQPQLEQSLGLDCLELGGQRTSLAVSLANVVETLLLEVALEVASILVAEQDLLAVAGEDIATRIVHILLKRQMKEGDLVVEAAGVE